MNINILAPKVGTLHMGSEIQNNDFFFEDKLE
jgi:hypothetical protein